MFKRANKVTALLVAAAAVVSLVPATAANASSRLGTKEGTIENAIAFKDGKYIYEGYKTDDDSKSIYFNGGEKDKPLDEVKDADDLARYGEKYAYMHDGSDNYLVDLTSGKVIDDESPADKADNASTKLRTALKKTDRYGKGIDVKIQGRDENHKDNKDNDEVVQNQFGDVWYSYAVTPEAESDGEKDLKDGAKYHEGKAVTQLYGFTNESGKYVDASKTANIYAYSTKREKIVKVEDFNSLDKDSGLVVTLNGQPEAIAQDKDYIYALASVQIKDTNADVSASKSTIKVDFGKVTTAAAVKFAGETFQMTEKGGLKQLKADINATCLGKVVPGYEYDDATYSYVAKEAGKKEALPEGFDADKVIFENGSGESKGKVTNATYLQKIAKAQGEKEKDAYLPKAVDSYQFDDESLFKSGDVHDAYKAVLEDDDDFKKDDNQYRVKDNTLYVTRVKEGKVKVFKLKMKKIKEEPAKKANLPDKKLDGYVVIKDGDADQDINKTDHFKGAVSIDVDGNTWCIDEGKIYKFNGTDKKEIFTCDRSLNTLNVYNEGSLIAWENGEDVYTTVQEGKAESDKEVTPAKIGWDKTDAGWTFYDGAGKQVIGSNKWVNPGGVWYMIKADGIMATGWFNDNGTWYFLDTTSGAMKTGWFNDNGTWYFLQSSGAMRTGWFNDNGNWYYLNANGSMAANTTVDGYTLGANGAWVR